MKPYQLPSLLFLVLIVWAACTPSDGVPTLKTRDLSGTQWQKNRIELFDSNQVLIRVIQPMEFEQKEILLFAEDKKLFKKSASPSNSNTWIDCGEWELRQGKLRIVIGLNQIVPDLCELVNYFQPIIYNEASISLEEKSLLIEKVGIDIHHHYLSGKERQDLQAGIITAHTYYQPTSEELIISEEPSCCLSLD
ncbi:MAG: hypothetical protein AAF587_13300 [Bacteroidota bacterium]